MPSSLLLGGLALAAPLALVALAILIPAALVLVVRDAKWRREALAQFGDRALLAQTARLPSSAERALRGGLVVAAFGMMLLALARPQWGATEAVARSQGGDVFFLLDLSRSMYAEDVRPSRLEAAKHAAGTIARALPESRVGLLVFGGSGFLQLPPTLDHSTFHRFLETASPDEIPDLATNYEAAADLAAAIAAREGDSTGAMVVMLSDGEDTDGKLMDAIGALQRARARVFTVGFGTPEGSTIPDREADGRIVDHRDFAGRLVVTRLNESNLRDIARLTNGVYARWTDDASVGPIVSELARIRARARTSSAGVSLSDHFQWPLALALLALAVEPLVVARRSR